MGATDRSGTAGAAPAPAVPDAVVSRATAAAPVTAAKARQRRDVPGGGAAVPRPGNHVIVMFGATGDLARRKLLPGLFHLAAAGLMPDRYQIIGSARADLTGEQFRDLAGQAIDEFGTSKPTGAAWQAFARRLSFASTGSGAGPLAAEIDRAEREIGGTPGRLFHLAIPPAAFEPTVRMLGGAGLARGCRVIFEKPFGTDLASARALNHDRACHLRASPRCSGSTTSSARSRSTTSWRSGSPTACSSRSGTAATSPTCRSTCPRRSRSRDAPTSTTTIGAYRDMIVTHLFQVLGFVAMEPPVSLDARHLRDETAKVFDALKLIDPGHVVRGQYAGYRDEPGVAPGSQTETMAAVRAEIDNWRWAGVPFFLRSGKRMAASRQVITLGFHQPPLRMFAFQHGAAGRRNEIVIDFADPGSITAGFLAKEPGATMRLGAAEMTFRYADSFGAAHGLEGYERLLLQAMLGDQTLFITSGAVERLWEVSAPLLDNPPPVQPYAPGSWGPQQALDHLAGR